MKKKSISAIWGVVAVCILIGGYFYIKNVNSIPNKEMAYMQLETKGEEFVLEQLYGCSRESLIKKWGEPEGMLSGFFGDVWIVKEASKTAHITVYYDSEGNVEHIRLETVAKSVKNG